MKKALQIICLALLFSTMKMYAQTYPFTLPTTVTASLDVTTSIREVANNKLLGANIGGFSSTDEKALVRKFNPVTVRFPSGVFINWYDWEVDGNRIYDDYVAKTYKGVPDSTYIKMINDNLNGKTGFSGLTVLNTERKNGTGKPFDMLWGYNMNYDDNKKSVARLRDSEAKGFEVNYIEMGNELFYGNQCSNRTSTPQKYVTVAKSLSDTLHKIKPGIKVSVPLAWRTPQSYIDYNKALTADTSYFDAVSIHKYVGSDPDVPATFTYGDVLGGRTLLEKDVNYARELAPTKPVWLTEWGVAAGSDFQAAAGLGMADCYLFLYENQKIYGRADWYCVNGLLNSFISFVGTSRDIKYPLEKTGYGAIHEILRSVFENSTLLDGTMTTSKFTNANGNGNVVSARVVEKDGKKIVFAVNLSNKPVVFTLKFDGSEYSKDFKHEALSFNTLDQNYAIGFDDNPLSLVKEGYGIITLPALSVNRISLGVADLVKFTAPTTGSVIQEGTNLIVKAEAGIAVSKVDLFLNDNLVRTITGTPYEWGLDQTIDPSLANFKKGFYTLKLIATNANSQTTQTEIAIECKDNFGQLPFSGVSIAVPGTIEVENYDIGGEGISYHDSNIGNTGAVYRQNDVDVGEFSPGLYNIGWTANGEWLEYTVNVTETAMYDVGIVYSAGRTTPAKIGLELFDESKLLFSNFTLPVTASWDKYETITKTNVQLSVGKHILRLNITTSGCNVDKLIFTKTGTSGTKTVQQDNLNVYPNPSANGQFNLSTVQNWEVFSLSGLLVLKGDGTLIDLGDFASGMYILKTNGQFAKLSYR